MTDSLGYRLKLAVIAPSTNTSVQPEMDDMRPSGVTNHFGRIFIPDDPIRNDADFEQLLVNILTTHVCQCRNGPSATCQIFIRFGNFHHLRPRE